MSFGTIIGVFVGFGLFIVAILLSTDNIFIFLNLQSFLLVIGGTLAAMFISYEARYVWLSLVAIWQILRAPAITRNVLTSEIGRIIRWGSVVQRNGLIALEQDLGKLRQEDSFLTFGVELVVSGYSGEEVRENMTNTVETTFQRNTVPANILKAMASTCPAFGMIGTLIGLVIMLDNMQDPSAIGPGLAIALITTLYGVIFSRLIFLPAALKIQQRQEIGRFRNFLVTEGLSMLADRRGPRYIQDRMNSYLDPSIHFQIDQQVSRTEAS